MTKFLPGYTRADLRDADDPGEGLRVARQAAHILEGVYGERLVNVVLFGSWVRGDAHEESDVDLLVVLDDARDRWDEIGRIVDALYTLELESGRAIEGVPISAEDFDDAARPFLQGARADGITVLERVQ
jgi:predicted nucleotidyltransferase